MKFRLFALLLALALLSGCGSSTATTAASGESAAEESTETVAAAESAATESEDSTEAEEPAAEATEEGFCFTSGEVVVAMGAEAAPLLEALGEPKNYFESESCAFEGLDKVYTYSGFKLNTYTEGEVDYILSIVFTNDTAETALGITIGSSREAVLSAYGEPTEESSAALVYDRGNSRLSFGISNEAVATVEYSLITD